MMKLVAMMCGVLVWWGVAFLGYCLFRSFDREYTLNDAAIGILMGYVGCGLFVKRGEEWKR